MLIPVGGNEPNTCCSVRDVWSTQTFTVGSLPGFQLLREDTWLSPPGLNPFATVFCLTASSRDSGFPTERDSSEYVNCHIFDLDKSFGGPDPYIGLTNLTTGTHRRVLFIWTASLIICGLRRSCICRTDAILWSCPGIRTQGIRIGSSVSYRSVHEVQ